MTIGNGCPSKSVTRALIFDFDGVIVDSNDIKDACYSELFQQFPDRHDAAMTFHRSHPSLPRDRKIHAVLREVIGLNDCARVADELERLFTENVRDRVISCRYLTGAEEFLRKSKESFSLYIASATPEVELVKILEARGILPWFKGVFGAPAKKSEILNHIVQSEALDKQEAIFFGDAHTDLEAAKNVGIPFVGIRGLSQFFDYSLVYNNLGEFEDVWYGVH